MNVYKNITENAESFGCLPDCTSRAYNHVVDGYDNNVLPNTMMGDVISIQDAAK